MKLDKYNIKITISDPQNEGTAMSLEFTEVPRTDVETLKLPFKGLMEQFEELVEDIEDKH